MLPKSVIHATRKLSDNFDGSPSEKKRNFSIEFKLNCNNEAKINVHRGVLIERVHYYAILAEEGRTIQEVVLIEKGALTKEYGKKIQNSGSIVVYAALLEEIQGHSD